MPNSKDAAVILTIMSAILVVGCSGSALQPISPASTNHNALVGNGTGASGLHQGFVRGEPFGQPRSYTVTDLGTMGGTLSIPGNLNNNGAVAGFSSLAGDAVIRSFLWENARMMDLGALPAGPNSFAQAVNESLQVTGAADGAKTKADAAGRCISASDLDSHAYIWQSGIMTDLGTLGGKSSSAFFANNSGQIVGISQIKAFHGGFCGSPPGSEDARAFLIENGKMRDIGSLGGYNSAAIYINDAGQIGGGSDVSTSIDPTLGFIPFHAYLRTNGVMRDLGTLGGGTSLARGLNNSGAAVGFSTLLGEQHVHAFLWQSGAMADLGTVDGDTDANASDINNAGQVVGDSDTSTTMRAFVWNKGVMTDLNSLISPSSGFQLASGVWINDAGQIAAIALVERTGEVHAVLLTPSNNSIRGVSRSVPLTASLRRFLLRGSGYHMMNVLTHRQS